MPLAALALLAGTTAAGEGPAPARVHTTEHRLYLAPGIQFGAFSQELSLTFGSAAVTLFEALPGEAHFHGGGGWLARGLRLTGVAHSWAPAAIHGVGWFSIGGWGWEWWPTGLEFALGGGVNGHQRYGLVQLALIMGIASRLEICAMVQWAIGRTSDPPMGSREECSGSATGSIWETRRERVSVQPLPPASQ